MRNQLKVERAWQAAGDLFRYLFLVRVPVIEVFKDLLRSFWSFCGMAVIAVSLRHLQHGGVGVGVLIDYCEGLNAGRSMEAMICAMIKGRWARAP